MRAPGVRFLLPAQLPVSARLPVSALLLPLLFMLGACASGTTENTSGKASTARAPDSSSIHPLSGLDVIPLIVNTKNGPHRFMVEVARTADEQSKGLMFRTDMAPDEGMLFPYSPPQLVSFWMKNTVLSLDLVFIDSNGKVINVAADAVPYSEAGIPSMGPAAAVLEINAGRAAELGIEPGSTVSW